MNQVNIFLFSFIGSIFNKEGSLIYLGDVGKPRAIMKNYLCIVNSNEVTLHLQEEEVVDAKWISLDELYTLKDELAGSCYDRFN